MDPGVGWDRSRRLVRSADHERLRKTGRRWPGRHLVALAAPAELGCARVGWAISRKVGGAVQRNQVRRWLRELMRHRYGALPVLDLVFIARPGAATAGLDGLAREVDGLLFALGRAA